MAIDFGRRRCGIAVTDPACIVANPLETVDTGSLIDFVTDYLRREAVSEVVVGFPRTVRGEDSDTVRYMTPVVNRLRKLIAPTPVTYFDERFTSVLAHRAMIDGGMPRMARREKGAADRISASIILNDYLGSRQYSQTNNKQNLT